MWPDFVSAGDLGGLSDKRWHTDRVFVCCGPSVGWSWENLEKAPEAEDLAFLSWGMKPSARQRHGACLGVQDAGRGQ